MTTELVESWHQLLVDDEEWLSWWTNTRGVSLHILRERRIGVQAPRNDSPDDFRYTIPVWDAAGELVDVKKYAPGAKEGKNKHTKGHGSPCRLAGVDWLAEADPATDEVWVVGGEPDQLRALTAGLLAVTSTSGEGALPRAEDLETLRGFCVNVCLDQDAAGRAGADKWINCLATLGVAAVKNVTWPAELGKDLTDYLNNGNTVASLLEIAANALPAVGGQRPLAELLAWAVETKLSAVGSRNTTGFHLACQLRDERYPRAEAERFMVEEYVPAVADRGDHEYTADAARASLEQAYSVEPRAKSPRATSTEDRDDKAKPTVAEKLLRIATERYRFGKAHDGRLIAVPNGAGDPNLARVINKGNGKLSDELASLYANAHPGKVPSSAALNDVMAVLRGRAGDADPEQLWMRVAEDGPGRLVVNLGDEEGRAVVVTPDGWEVVGRSPVLFQRTDLTGALPVPERGGRIEALREFLNTSEVTFDLIVALLVSYLFPNIAHGILLYSGEYGTAKTSASRYTRMMFDPSPVPTQRRPTKEDDWDTSVSASWSVCLENVSTIPDWLSDALCRASTGDGRIKRKHYSDNDAFAEAVRRVVILNGIAPLGIRDDLMNRLVVAELSAIAPADRKQEADLDRTWARAWPAMFGALLDLTSGVLAVRADGRDELEELPRLADSAKVFRAVDLVRGTDALGTFYEKSRTAATELAEENTLTVAIEEFLYRERRHAFSGSAADLLKQLDVPMPRPPDWPGNARVLGSQLVALSPGLRQLGWKCEARRSNGAKLWELTLPAVGEGR